MEIKEIKNKISTEYPFLKENDHLGSNIIMLGLGGSHAYGTNIETSDLDVRGVSLNSKEEILLGKDFEQVIDLKTDTVIYSFNKFISLLLNSNPNVIELLGLNPEHYLYVSTIGKEILDHKKLFLSKKCINSFGGYANQQLYRLKQKAVHKQKNTEMELHILKNLQAMQEQFKTKYSKMEDDSIKLYIDHSIQKDFDQEIFMDITLTHYPLRDYCSLWNELQNTVKSYAKIGRRENPTADHGKIAKYSMHLVRLYLMCLDLLETEEVVTYRENEHDLLMDIRNGKYLKNNYPTKEFFDIINELENRLDYAKKNTSLPEAPKLKEIQEFVMNVNEKIIKGLF